MLLYTHMTTPFYYIAGLRRPPPLSEHHPPVLTLLNDMSQPEFPNPPTRPSSTESWSRKHKRSSTQGGSTVSLLVRTKLDPTGKQTGMNSGSNSPATTNPQPLTTPITAPASYADVLTNTQPEAPTSGQKRYRRASDTSYEERGSEDNMSLKSLTRTEIEEYKNCRHAYNNSGSGSDSGLYERSSPRGPHRPIGAPSFVNHAEHEDRGASASRHNPANTPPLTHPPIPIAQPLPRMAQYQQATVHGKHAPTAPAALGGDPFNRPPIPNLHPHAGPAYGQHAPAAPAAHGQHVPAAHAAQFDERGRDVIPQNIHAQLPADPPPPPQPAFNKDEYLLERVREARKLKVRNVPDPEPVIQTTVLMPQAGWPEIHGPSPTHPCDNVEEEQLEVWLGCPGYKLYGQVMRHNSWGEDAGKQADIMSDIINDVLETTEFSISPANQQEPFSHPQDPPYSFLISDLSRDLYRELLRQHCLATVKGQVLIFDMHHMGPASFLCTVNGLVASNLLNMDETKTNVLRNDMASLLFKSAFTSILDYAMYIRPMHADDSMEDYNDVVRNVLDRLSVRVLPICLEGNVVRPSVNLYLDLPGKSDVRRAAIIDEVRETQFRTTHFGRGHIAPGWVCSMCRAIDHPTGLCPFALLPDWNLVTRKPKQTPKPDQGTSQGPPTRGYSRGGHPNAGQNRRGSTNGGYRGRGQQRG